jgi:hypothetical protein
MTGDVAQLLAACFTQYQSQAAATPAETRTLNIGQLVSMDWKLGVAVQSSNCKALRVPYVSIVMRISDQEGNTKCCPMELTVPEFQASPPPPLFPLLSLILLLWFRLQDFSRTMHTVGASMETL